MIINTDSQNDNFFFNERISNFLKAQVLQVTNRSKKYGSHALKSSFALI